MKSPDKYKENKADTKSLSDMKEGESAVITGCDDRGRNIVERLCDIGFAEGEEVKCVHVSMLGDPLAYLIRGSVIALRKADGKCISVKPLKQTHEEVGICHTANIKVSSEVKSSAR